MTLLNMEHLEKVFLEESNKIEGVTGQAALNDAIGAWLEVKHLKRISEDDILRVHRTLMIGRLPNEDVGVWTKHQTNVAGKNNPEPWKVPALMAAWIDDINSSLNVLADPEQVAKHFHVRFEHIHPFVDGNGRVGRILLMWHRLKLGLPVEVIYNKNKKDYYSWF